MSIFALVILRGSANLVFPYICANAVAAQGNGSVEVFLPKGGYGLLLSGSGWSAVFGVDADGGASLLRVMITSPTLAWLQSARRTSDEDGDWSRR
jgi:hypothetical protein